MILSEHDEQLLLDEMPCQTAQMGRHQIHQQNYPLTADQPRPYST